MRALTQRDATSDLQSLVEFVEQSGKGEAGRPHRDSMIFAAYAHRHLKQYREALALCDEVLAADPASGAAWIVKAETHYEARQFAEAVDAARRSCDTRYSTYPFRCLFGYLRSMGRIDEAFNVCIRGLELFPRELSFQELLDGIVLEFRLLDRYLEACRRLFPLIEDKASFLGNEATVFLRMGDLAQARALYEQALAYGDYNWLHAQLGVVLRSQGDFPGAEARCKRRSARSRTIPTRPSGSRGCTSIGSSPTIGWRRGSRAIPAIPPKPRSWPASINSTSGPRKRCPTTTRSSATTASSASAAATWRRSSGWRRGTPSAARSTRRSAATWPRPAKTCTTPKPRENGCDKPSRTMSRSPTRPRPIASWGGTCTDAAHKFA